MMNAEDAGFLVRWGCVPKLLPEDAECSKGRFSHLVGGEEALKPCFSRELFPRRIIATLTVVEGTWTPPDRQPTVNSG